jgi:HlyD family secretion protein
LIWIRLQRDIQVILSRTSYFNLQSIARFWHFRRRDERMNARFSRGFCAATLDSQEKNASGQRLHVAPGKGRFAMLERPDPHSCAKLKEAPTEPSSRLKAAPPEHKHRSFLATQLWAWKWSLGAAVVGLAAAWQFGPALMLGRVVAVDRALRGEFVQTVVASGHVEAPFRVNIGSQILGVVADVPVSEGQKVKAGDTLIVLDDSEAKAAVVQAEGLVMQAEARVRQMRELALPSAEQSLAQAKATLLNAQQAHDRASTLARDGYGTRAALDDATRALDIARAQMRSAEFQVYTNRPGGSDFVMAETQASQARATLTSAQSRLGYTIIKAPRDGTLITRNVERGNVVQQTAVLMVLSPAGESQIVVQIDEKNLGLIAAGQHALVSADAYAQQTFAAEVFYINPGIDLQRASVEVKLKVPQPPPYLREDMTVSVDIQVASQPDAIVVPTSSIRQLSGAAPWVLKIAEGHARRQPVRVGLVSGGKAQILSGLQAGDLMVPASDLTVKEGQRVRAAALAGAAR